MKAKSIGFWYVMFIWVLSFGCIKGFSMVDIQRLEFKYCIIGYFIVTRFIIRPLAIRSVAYLNWKSFVPILQDYEYLDTKRSKILFISCYLGALILGVLSYFFFVDIAVGVGVSVLSASSVLMYMFLATFALAFFGRGVFAVSILRVIDETDDVVAERKVTAQIFRLFSRILAFIPVLRTMTFMYMMLYDVRLEGSR